MPAHLRADDEHILEPIVCDQRSAGQPALDDGVGGDRGSVGQVADLGGGTGGAFQQCAKAVHEPGLDPVGRRADLGDVDPPVVDDHRVGERSAHIDSDATHETLASMSEAPIGKPPAP